VQFIFGYLTMSSKALAPIWQIAFRPFFLFASLFFSLALIIWGCVLADLLPTLSSYQGYSNWMTWHSHELIFGFVQAIAIGFLLTASRNWAGQAGISSNWIKLLITSWLAARFAWLLPSPIWLVASLDAATPALAAIGLAQTLSAGEKDNGKGSQKHNWPFVLLLWAFVIVQLLFHALLTLAPQYISILMQASVLMMAAMTLWVSGRVLPFFTRARLQTQAAVIPQRLLQASMASSWLLVPSLALGLFFPELEIFRITSICLALIAAISQSQRLYLFYRPGVTSEAMLWSLYLAFGWIIIGYVVLALNLLLKLSLPWLHAITLGGLITMIISMMARISLGHTGRPIRALKGIIGVFIALQLASLVRIFLPHTAGYLLAITFTLLALLIFLFHYLPILLKPRADGKPG
jgi:uncharacterized protein involved in response to NO